MKKFLSLLIILSFMGSSFDLFSIGPVTINLFRFAFILFVISHFVSLSEHESCLVAKKYQIYFGLIVFLNFFTLIQMPSLSAWIDGCIFYSINIAIIYFVYTYTDTEEDLKSYMTAYAIGVFITVVVSIYEYITGNHVVDANYFSVYNENSWQYRELSKAPTAFLYNPNNVGVAILMGFGFGFMQKNKKSNWFKYMIWIAACIYAAFATGSRGAIILIFFSLLLTGFIMSKNFTRKILIFIIIAVFVLILYFVFEDFIWEQLERAGFNNDGSLFDDSRWNLIATTFKASAGSGFLGTGPKTSEIVLQEVYGLRMPAVHNFWMEFLLNQGLISLIVFISFYLRCIKVQLNLRRNNGSILNSIILLELIMFAFAVFVPPTIITLYFIWIIFGLSMASEKVYYYNTGIII